MIDLEAARRERDAQVKASPASLSDQELLATVLGSPEDAQTLLSMSNGCLKTAVSSVDGKIRRSSARRAIAAVELARRLSTHKDSRQRLVTPRQVYEHVRSRFMGMAHEEVHVLCLNSRNVVVRDVRVAMGGVSHCAVDPREVFAPAILARASAIILTHNHPSGDPEPSNDDERLTRQLADAARLMAIKFLDHIIVGEMEKFTSMKELGKC